MTNDLTPSTPLDRRFLLGGLAGAAGISALAAMSKAGPLTPPAGAVSSTAKPLSDVEPRTAINPANTPGDSTALFVINAPGSYYLTGNITGVPSKHAIKVNSSDVTIDLCGFAVRGVLGSGDGINTTAAVSRNLVVTNGTITDFSGYGVNVINGTSCRFEGLQLSVNGQGGLVTGSDAVIERVTVRAGVMGISAGDRSRLTACEVRDITGSGAGIAAGQNCVLIGCVSVGCSGPCIAATNGSVLRDCNGSGSTASHGIRLSDGASAAGCIANGNLLNGIEALQRNKVIDCSAVGNGQSGIRSIFGGHVQGCFCGNNGNCGIISDLGGAVTIRGNTCLLHGNAAGIRVTAGSLNLVEGNVVSFNYRGIEVTSARNIILANRVGISSNNDYSIVANNTYGPIVEVSGVGDLASVANANHPQANLRY